VDRNRSLHRIRDGDAPTESAAKADGKVTGAERAQLRGEERRTSRAIARKKHNLRSAPATLREGTGGPVPSGFRRDAGPASGFPAACRQARYSHAWIHLVCA
jgi:hypothetical protein